MRNHVLLQVAFFVVLSCAVSEKIHGQGFLDRANQQRQSYNSKLNRIQQKWRDQDRLHRSTYQPPRVPESKSQNQQQHLQPNYVVPLYRDFRGGQIGFPARQSAPAEPFFSDRAQSNSSTQTTRPVPTPAAVPIVRSQRVSNPHFGSPQSPVSSRPAASQQRVTNAFFEKSFVPEVEPTIVGEIESDSPQMKLNGIEIRFRSGQPPRRVK